jgi:RNA exonuclease 4
MSELVALDCEMVGTGPGGYTSVLARVSVVNKYGNVLYDRFVKPRNGVKITDYRTRFSGVRPEDLVNGKHRE